MSLETFKNALDYDDIVSIGGGEPTLHPDFWQFIGLSLGKADYVWLATNGSQTDTAMALARLAEREVLGCELSIDYYHAEIDKKVVNRFQRLNKVRNVNNTIVKHGRAIRTETYRTVGCCCEDLFVDPSGYIYSCGCKKLKIGHVETGFNENYALLNKNEEYVNGMCIYNNQEFLSKFKEQQ